MQLRAACKERKIAVDPKEVPAEMIKKLSVFKISVTISEPRAAFFVRDDTVT